MMTETVKDYLGHPCAIHEARSRFLDELTEARKVEDSRARARQIGLLINDLDRRHFHEQEAVQAALDVLPNSTDDDQTRAVLTMALEFFVKSHNKFRDLSGHVLATLEAADVEGMKREVSHG